MTPLHGQYSGETIFPNESIVPLPAEEESSDETPLEVSSFEFEFHTAYIEDFLMAGLLARLYLFEYENAYSHLTVRYSVDLRQANMWFMPYFGITLPRIGGFEIGHKPSDPMEFHVPGWVTWRIFGGDERIFAISADILTNVPIGAIGYYDAGVKFRIRDDGSMMYIGFANYGKNRDEVFVFGPAVKTWWALGDGSMFLLNGSYILNNPEGPADYVRFTVSAGWRVSF